MPSYRVKKAVFGYRAGHIIVAPKDELGILEHYVEPVVITPVYTPDVFRVMAGPKVTPSTVKQAEAAPVTTPTLPVPDAPKVQAEITLPELPKMSPPVEKKAADKTPTILPPKPKV